MARIGKKPYDDRAERLAKEVAVREAGQQDRNELGAASSSCDERLDRLPERRVERRTGAAGSLEPFELVAAVAERFANERLEVGLRLTGKQPAVADDLARAPG